MSVQFICYPTCSTCKKAKKWLEQNNIEFVERNIKTHNPTREELIKWLEQSEYPLKKFFNTHGTLYRQLDIKNKVNTTDEKELIDLLSTDGMLIKRPLVISKQHTLIGFNHSKWEILLKD